MFFFRDRRIKYFLILIGGLVFGSSKSWAKPATGYWGFTAGYARTDIPSDYRSSIGGGTPSGSSAIAASSTVYRDISTNLAGFQVGAIAGTKLMGVGFDVYALYYATRGAVSRYVAGSSGASTVTIGNFDYNAISVDLGTRIPLKPRLYLRPSVGKVISGQYSADFLDAQEVVKFKESSSPTIVGLHVIYLLPFKWLPLELDLGVNQYSSSLGGKQEQYAVSFNLLR